MLPEEVRSPPRASCYDNVHDLRPLSEQVNKTIHLSLSHDDDTTYNDEIVNTVTKTP